MTGSATTSTGARFGGRYEIADVMGRGGMATVYRATDTRLGRDVAVKVLSSSLAGDQAFVERFEREAQAASLLHHPHIVSVLDAGEDDGRPYIVMELVDGPALDQVLRERGPLDPSEAASIAADVCEALECAHEHGIVHRDIKPANILLTAGGRAKVTDFGIARLEDYSPLTRTRTIVGTVQYMSPEHVQGKTADARSDLYSLGCVMYEMLSGRPPFDGDNAVAVALMHTKEVPAPLPPDVPPTLRDVVRRAMDKRPASRFENAAAMRAATNEAVAAPDAPTQTVQRLHTEQLTPDELPVNPPWYARFKPSPNARLWTRAIGTAIVGLLLVPLLVGGTPAIPGREAAATAPSAAPGVDTAHEAVAAEPEPEPSPDPLTRLSLTLNDATRAGELSPTDAGDLLANVHKAVAEVQSGDVHTAGRRMQLVLRWLEARVAEGEMSGETGGRIVEAITGMGLPTAPPAPPPREVEHEDEDGERSKGKGKGKQRHDDD